MKKIIKSLLFISSIFLSTFVTSCANTDNTDTSLNTTNETITSTNIITSTNTALETTNESITSTDITTTTVEAKESLGTWWWNRNLDIDEYLNFAVSYNINEIYFCDYSLGDNLKKLLEKAYDYNIDIYLLAGEKEWLNDRSDLDTIINNYIEFQKNNEYKLAGIHLDIEPHQFSDFSANRANYLYKLIDIIKTNKELYNDINFDYDIPFWLDDDITYDNVNKKCYQHIIDYANRVFIMSYRDEANKMLDVSIDEINYAKDNNKILFLSAETYSLEGDQVSFLDEGKAYMLDELNKLRVLIPNNFGIAIHNIQSFKELKD